MRDIYSIRPLMSGSATLLIASGTAMLGGRDIFGLILIIAGLTIYAFKALLYKNGFFLTDSEIKEIEDSNKEDL